MEADSDERAVALLRARRSRVLRMRKRKNMAIMAAMITKTAIIAIAVFMEVSY